MIAFLNRLFCYTYVGYIDMSKKYITEKKKWDGKARLTQVTTPSFTASARNKAQSG